VRLTEDVEMFKCIYTKGHEFTVYGSSFRGWDLIDDDGNKIDECLFIHDKLELVSENEKLTLNLKLKDNLLEFIKIKQSMETTYTIDWIEVLKAIGYIYF
jgi:hypothetical protein